MKKYFAAVIILLFSTFVCSAAELQLSPLFGNNMVLQRSTTVPVWGLANAGENISVSFAGQLMQTTADENGNWKVLLTPMAASSKPSTLTVTSSSSKSVRRNNILVGDIWLCSGQSNMYMPVINTDNSAQAIALRSGFCKCCSKETRKKAKPLTWEHGSNVLPIQLRNSLLLLTSLAVK